LGADNRDSKASVCFTGKNSYAGTFMRFKWKLKGPSRLSLFHINLAYREEEKFFSKTSQTKEKEDMKLLHCNNLKTGTFKTLPLEDFPFTSFKRRYLSSTNKPAVSGLPESLPNYCHFVKSLLNCSRGWGEILVFLYPVATSPFSNRLINNQHCSSFSYVCECENF
jgi:hypothetical protein